MVMVAVVLIGSNIASDALLDHGVAGYCLRAVLTAGGILGALLLANRGKQPSA
jgi:hypothetical protein